MLSHYQLFRKIVASFPLKLQAKWDQSRLVCEKTARNNQVKNIYVGLELESKWFEKHQINKHDFYLIHHPIFTKNIVATKKALNLLTKIKKAGAAILFMHTNYDFHFNGMNYQYAQNLNPKNIDAISVDENGAFVVLKKPVSFSNIVSKLQTTSINLVYDQAFIKRKIQKIQILLGSGASLIGQLAKAKQVDLFITGDVKWHDWQDASDYDLAVLDVHHSTEWIFADHLINFLNEQFIAEKLVIKKLERQLKLQFKN